MEKVKSPKKAAQKEAAQVSKMKVHNPTAMQVELWTGTSTVKIPAGETREVPVGTIIPRSTKLVCL